MKPWERGSIVSIEPEFLDKEGAGQMLGGPHVLRIVRRMGWIAPVEERSRLTLYDTSDVREVAERIRRDGLPKLTDAREEE